MPDNTLLTCYTYSNTSFSIFHIVLFQIPFFKMYDLKTFLHCKKDISFDIYSWISHTNNTWFETKFVSEVWANHYCIVHTNSNTWGSAVSELHCQVWCIDVVRESQCVASPFLPRTLDLTDFLWRTLDLTVTSFDRLLIWRTLHWTDLYYRLNFWCERRSKVPHSIIYHNVSSYFASFIY